MFSYNAQGVERGPANKATGQVKIVLDQLVKDDQTKYACLQNLDPSRPGKLTASQRVCLEEAETVARLAGLKSAAKAINGLLNRW
jgi:hypothetical protein